MLHSKAFFIKNKEEKIYILSEGDMNSAKQVVVIKFLQ